jgi:hypothetical protein
MEAVPQYKHINNASTTHYDASNQYDASDINIVRIHVRSG